MIAILGGKAKGCKLTVPKGDQVRPTSVLLRRRIFDAHQNFQGDIFIDLCAGTGAVGLEALSRGADQLYFIETDRGVYSLLTENIVSMRERYLKDSGEKIVTVNSRCEKWLPKFLSDDYQLWDEALKKNTIIFLDPPYSNENTYSSIIETLTQNGGYLGELWIESDSLKGIDLEELQQRLSKKNLKIHRSYKQGASFIAIISF